MKATDFFTKYFDLEWQAYVSHASAETIEEAERTLALVDALRGPGVQPRYVRTEWDEMEELAEYLEDTERRHFFAVTTHQESSVAIAYTGDFNIPVSRGMSVRYVAKRQPDGTWLVIANQHYCTKCKGVDSKCPKCAGSGWTEWFGEEPGQLGPPDSFTQLEVPTRKSSEATWAMLVGSLGHAWT